MSTTVFAARKILTMNPSQPTATHIAVRDGRILGVGTLETLASLQPFELDQRFADAVILPGFVEGHSHALEGVMWDYLYLGYFPRRDPEGRRWEGLDSVARVQQRLAEQAATLAPGEPLIAWGFDPIYFDGARLDRHAIDAAVSDRPVAILHANLHVMTVNSAMIDWVGIHAAQNIEGVLLGADGQPSGELQEMAAMHAVMSRLQLGIQKTVEAPSLLRYARACRNVGITTATDLYNPLSDEAREQMRLASEDADFAIRLLPAMGALSYDPEDGVARVLAAREESRDNLGYGLVKLMTDGSIQGYTARLQWPHYHDGQPNGMWNAPPETLKALVLAYHQAGLQLHIHTNGDEAVELMLDALEEALTLWPRADHRHTLQHCQIIGHAQMRRAQRLGVCLNMFSNHLYYWGDIHYTRTLGHERCQRLEPIASARRLGIVTTVHCDAPVTPLGSLFTAWCAVSRTTASGRLLGEFEKVGVEDALRMITLDAAYTLRMDHLVGSLEIGKFADMAVLGEDPTAVDPERLRDIPVLATVLGGRVAHVD